MRERLAEYSLHPYFPAILSKPTARNQLTVPRRASDALGVSEAPTHFEVEVDEGRIVLTATRVGSADAVRRELAEPGITDHVGQAAVAVARPLRHLVWAGEHKGGIRH
jgi:hypothetical protein